MKRGHIIRVISLQRQFCNIGGKPVLAQEPGKYAIVPVQDCPDSQLHITYILIMPVVIPVLAGLAAELSVRPPVEYCPAFKACLDARKILD